MEKEVLLSQINNIEKFSNTFSSLQGDYVFTRLDNNAALATYWHTPMRVNGMTMILCLSGNVDMDVDLDNFKLSKDTLMIIGSERLLRINHVDWSNMNAYILVVSPDFIRDINIDINILNSVHYSPAHVPLFQLSEQEMALMKSYFEVIHFNTVTNPDDLYVRSISRCIIAAIVYQMLQFARKRMVDNDVERPRSRRNTYVRDFMQLVHAHYRKHRSVSFYAEKLFISPKYLSMVMREMTGKSAAEWIDDMVILEAKNLLRFSGKNIQQIAYELNFNNQSSFGKYFKHLTGMSPTEYQRT